MPRGTKDVVMVPGNFRCLWRKFFYRNRTGLNSVGGTPDHISHPREFERVGQVGKRRKARSG